MASSSDVDTLGPWRKTNVLGKGGFGIVMLWHDNIRNVDLAIKKLRENELEGVIKSKQKERWCKEVEIMSKLDHPNIVKALPVPEELSVLKDNLPLLAMEYCSLGDLRQVLSQPANSSGLKESEVRCILQDITNGLSYLHASKIIHRDLKPDNIVLQSSNGRIVYKLIDLGYAKELDKNSLCQSFVGTIQYLAPELFLGKQYTCSVDYWSLGIVTYEILTGYRPFLPGFTPANWIKYVKNKKRDIIVILQDMNGEIKHNSDLARVNHICNSLKVLLEGWLQVALDWNGELRGREVHTKDLIIFKSINEIINKTFIKLFCVPTYEVLVFQIDNGTSVYQLQCWVQDDTGLAIEDQILLAQSGKSVNYKTTVFNSFQNQIPQNDEICIFIYNCGHVKVKRKNTKKSSYVKELLEDPKKLMNYKDLKQSCTESIFFLQAEHNLYQYLCQSLQIKIDYVKQRCEAIKNLYDDVCEEWNQVECVSQFMILSHKTDLENYIEMRKNGELQSSGLVQKWIDRVTDVENKLSGIRNTSNRLQQKTDVEKASTMIINLENGYKERESTKNMFLPLVEEASRLYEIIQKIPKEKRNVNLSNTEMVKLVYKCLENGSKLVTNSTSLDMLFVQITETENHLAKLVSPLTIWLKSSKIMKQVVENVQFQRQKDIWNLIRQTNKLKKDEDKRVIKLVEIKKVEKQPDVDVPEITKILENTLLEPENKDLKEDEKVFETIEFRTEKKKSEATVEEAQVKKVEVVEKVEDKNIADKVVTLQNKVEDANSIDKTDTKLEPICNDDDTEKERKTSSDFSPFHIPKTVNSCKTPSDEHIEVLKTDFRISEPVSINFFPRVDVRFNDNQEFQASVDAKSIIMDNNTLRYRTQDLTAKCHQIVQDVQSFNWDFLYDKN